MGRPGVKLNKQGASSGVKKRISSSDLNPKQKKEKRNAYYKNKFKSYLGNSKEGHGFVAAQKRKFLSRFNRRKFKKKKTKNEAEEKENSDTTYTKPKPLGEDSNLYKSMGDTTQCWSASLQDCSDSGDVTATADASNIILSKENESSLFGINKTETTRKKKSTTNLKLVEIDYLAIQEERKRQYEVLEANRSQHEKVVSKNIEKRRKVANKFSKRTKRGQPVMANRLESLLDKIKINGT